MFVKHFPDLVLNEHIYVSLPPLYRLDFKNSVLYAISDEHMTEVLKQNKIKSSDPKLSITRFKGLGEMNPSQLRDTTLNPSSRKLLLLSLENKAKDMKLLNMMLSKKTSIDRKLWLEKKGNLVQAKLMAKNKDLFSSNIDKISIGAFSEDAYLNYSMYVILDRALPSLLDGLKPVQRRIIYAMSELGLKHNTKHKKSARTVGDVLGKFHPHGDTACYEAMVMMAQSFSYNSPLIDGQGNWGTQDDPKSFAAMRYTESKLTKYSDLLLRNLKNGTVDWIPNFDGSLDEPKFLPSLIPNILVNGSSGIAVGMSTDIPPHNLGEIILAVQHLIKNPKCSVKDLIDFIPAPDYPTGGSLLRDESDIDEIYNEGTGNIKLRAEYTSKSKEITINSLPYQASTTKIIEQIQSQIIEKKISFIGSVEDQSDEKNPVKIIIRIKGSSVSAEDVMNHLYFTTDLERSYRANLNIITSEGKPKVMNLREFLSMVSISYRYIQETAKS